MPNPLAKGSLPCFYLDTFCTWQMKAIPFTFGAVSRGKWLISLPSSDAAAVAGFQSMPGFLKIFGYPDAS
jgi:hypothetical protein